MRVPINLGYRDSEGCPRIMTIEESTKLKEYWSSQETSKKTKRILKKWDRAETRKDGVIKTMIKSLWQLIRFKICFKHDYEQACKFEEEWF